MVDYFLRPARRLKWEEERRPNQKDIRTTLPKCSSRRDKILEYLRISLRRGYKTNAASNSSSMTRVETRKSKGTSYGGEIYLSNP